MEYDNTSMTIVEQTTMGTSVGTTEDTSEDNNMVELIIGLSGLCITCLCICILPILKYYCPDDRWENTRQNCQCRCCKVESQTNGQSEMETVPLLDSDRKIGAYLRDKQTIFCRNIKNFTPAILNKRWTFDLTDIFTELELPVLEKGRKQESEQTIGPPTLDKVLAKIKPTCKVLIDGEGGIGKSTLLRHIAHDRPTGIDKVFEDKILFLLNVRDLKKDDTSILDLIVRQFNMEEFSIKTKLQKDPTLIKEFIVNHDEQIVLLIDGLDELRFENESVIDLFRKKTLSNSVVILTSRSENINEFINTCDVHVKVKGFSKESISKFIGKHFDYLDKQELGNSLIKELFDEPDFFEDEKRHPGLCSMCKNPLLLLSICIMWEDKQNLPDRKSDLFKEMFRNILNQFIEKQHHILLSKFEDAPVEYINAMILLGKCMYQSLKVNQLSISKTDLEALCCSKNIVDKAVNLGFVYEDAPISRSNFEQIYMTPHKLIVESLVGFYLYKVVESDVIGNECTEDVKLFISFHFISKDIYFPP